MRFSHSLKENSVFRRLYAKGKSAASSYLVVYCRKNGRQENRIGITVSKKLGHAVVRNRVRRRFREIYRLHEAEFGIGWDLVHGYQKALLVKFPAGFFLTFVTDLNGIIHCFLQFFIMNIYKIS